ncbi:MAG: GIY-YIG nuclease family protein [Oscillospiraceae bacterium]|nr:GIY-YIG nuclease family protein [Oscillospiraceae bacterium]
MSYTLYILRCGDGTLYTGITNDLPRRLSAHRAGTGAKYTRGRGPLSLVYTEPCADKSAALRRELYIKRLPRQKKEALLAAAASQASNARPTANS